MDAHERRYRIASARVRIAAELARAAAWDREAAHEEDAIERRAYCACADEARVEVMVAEGQLRSLAALCHCGAVATNVTGVCAACATDALCDAHVDEESRF